MDFLDDGRLRQLGFAHNREKLRQLAHGKIYDLLPRLVDERLRRAHYQLDIASLSG